MLTTAYILITWKVSVRNLLVVVGAGVVIVSGTRLTRDGPPAETE